MAVTALNALSAIPVSDDTYITGHAINTTPINPGDWCVFSGTGVIACSSALSYWKNSGAGVAMTRNPAIDQFGNSVVNSGVIIATHGVFRVSAAFSGQPLLGLVACPDTTGSGVNSPTGLTGLGATWNTATPAITYPQAITYDYRDLASAISAYVDSSASGSALLPGSGLLSANATSAVIKGVAQVIGWYNSGPGGTGQMDIRLWNRNADYY